MGLAEGIRKHGFRKWYERELMQSHLHMLMLLLCTIGLLGAFEVFSRKAALADQIGVALSALACVAIGAWSMRRYLYLLLHAEEMARQAVCAQCQVYGSLEVQDGATREGRIGVRCKRCGHAWLIDG